ncbi:MAG: DHH family phosphoesterase [Oscillospiraceae bacterium]|nr:DHH family phosphoesterase [Oscillospiraceae bacterium]
MKIFKKLFFSSNYIRLIVNVIISLVFFAVYVILFAPEIPAALIIAALYIAALIVVEVIYRLISKKTPVGAVDEISPLLSNITLDLMVKLYMPAIICDETDKIVWHNNALKNKLRLHESIYGRFLQSVCGHTSAEIAADTSESGLETAFDDNFYRIKGYVLSSQQKKYIITVWNDNTELNRAYQRLKDDDTIIGYIVIDNLDELLQFVQDKYRSASSDVSALLQIWANTEGGILKEFERDKFIFICSQTSLDKFIAERFDILDKIRDIRLGESSLPVTVSIGMANISGTLQVKERAAHAALEMALQRGGDQVVIKYDEDMDYIGGRTKGVQKRTKVKARVIANELIMLMSKSSNVLIMTHRFADFDAVGACAGIARMAFFCGAKINIVANTDDPNLAKCFKKLSRVPEYQSGGIFVNAADAQDLITSETLLVIVDVNNKDQFESADIADNAHSIVYIDHHRKAAEFKDTPIIQYIEPSASSTCELISIMLEQSIPAGLLHKEESEIMFAGILLDTMQFTRNTGVRTFSAVLYLRGEDADPVEAQALFNISVDDFMRETKFESNITTYKKFIAIAVNDSPGTPADRIAGAKVADKLLKIDNIIASFALCRIGDVINISARSSGTFNVQVIVEKLGGGGHYDSAATQVRNSSMADALTRLKNAIDEYIKETQE